MSCQKRLFECKYYIITDGIKEVKETEKAIPDKDYAQ